MATTKKTKTEEEYETMYPKGIEVKVDDTTYLIYPLPDEICQRILSAIIRTSSVFLNVGNILSTNADGKVKATQLATLAEILEDTIVSLVPDISAIISAALNKEQDWVQKNFRLADRIRILRAVFEAEDIPKLLGELQALAKLLPKTAEPAQTVMENQSPQETSTI